MGVRPSRISRSAQVVLRHVRHTIRTRRRYLAAGRRFDRFCMCTGVTIDESLPLQADKVGEQFVQALFVLGAPRSHAAVFRCALVDRFPALGRQLPRTKQAILGWQTLEGVRRAPPFTRELLVILVSWLWHKGAILAAGFFAVCFAGYLRPSEGVKLRGVDVEVASDKGVVRLRDTKTSRRKGADEFVDFDDPFVLALLRQAKRLRRDPAEPIFGLSYAQARAILREFLAVHSLQSFGFRLYSFRRGGAAYDFRLHGSYDRALHRGRWQQISTAKIYLSDAQASLVSLQSVVGTLHETFLDSKQQMLLHLKLGGCGSALLQ